MAVCHLGGILLFSIKILDYVYIRLPFSLKLRCLSLNSCIFFNSSLILTSSAWTELAASIPRVEFVGKGEYFRFGMRDSLAIEASFLQVSYHRLA